MRTIVFVIVLLCTPNLWAEGHNEIVLKYFEFPFEEDVVKHTQPADLELGKPTVGRFTSNDGKRMVVVSALLNNGKSYYALMSVGERKMGYLTWKARGFGTNPGEDLKYYLQYDGREFDYEGW